ncbi:MAG: head decoration protein [Gemmatimonadota bacterium]|nr:head decoration protein [Gemmatimonadota bacterium]
MNPASFSETTYSPDRLIAGHLPIASKKVTLLSGENRTRGAVLGKISEGAQSVASAAVAGNTGDGTIGTVSADANVAAGVYRATCIEPAANGGTFEVTRPDGVVDGIARVGVAYNGSVNFTIADGAADFIAGDSFTVTVSYAAGEKYKLSASAAVDGSETPDVILVQDCDASAGDAEALVYTRGDFNSNALTLGAGHTVASIREGLRGKGINLVGSQAA